MVHWDSLGYRVIEMYNKYMWSCICYYLCIISQFFKENNFIHKRENFYKIDLGGKALNDF